MKRKPSFDKEEKLIKKYKITPCSVNMSVLNPALWILDLTVDVMVEHNKTFKYNSILRIMNGYANTKKHLIPISYINKNEIKRILRADQLIQFTNLESLLQDCSPQVNNDNDLLEYIHKRLNRRKFRKTDFFKNIYINCHGLYDTILHSSFKDIDLISTDNIKTVKNVSANLFYDVSGNNTDLKNIINNCRFLEEFVKLTNVNQLANTQIQKLGLVNITAENRNALIEIIVGNTWKQMKELIVPKTRQTKFNSEYMLHVFVLEHMRSLKFDNYNEKMNDLKTFYRNYDACEVPIAYLKNIEILEIFPNLATILKFTNILKPYWERNEFNINSIKKQVNQVYENLVNDPNYRKEDSNQTILVNCKFLFNPINCTGMKGYSIDDEILDYYTISELSKTATDTPVTANECMRMEDHNNDGDIEYFTKLELSKTTTNIPVASNSICHSFKKMLIDKQHRRRNKMLNQIQTKLNIVEGEIPNEIDDENVGFENCSSESNVTVIHCGSEKIVSLDDQQTFATIVVPEYNTQFNKLSPKRIDSEIGINKDSSIIKDNTRIVETESSNLDGHESMTIQHLGFSKDLSPKTAFSEIVPSPNKLGMLNNDTYKNITFRKTPHKPNLANTSSVVCFSNKREQVIIVDSPTKSHGNKTIPNSSSAANLSEILELSYAANVANPTIIADLRKQNYQKKINKNPESEIPVMRNTYKPLEIKEKIIL